MSHPSFVYSAPQEPGKIPTGLADQDWLQYVVLTEFTLSHIVSCAAVTNCVCSVLKKLFNPMCSMSRTLQIGDYRITFDAIQAVYDQNGPVVSGIRFTDKLPSRNKQNVPPILRMIAPVRY